MAGKSILTHLFHSYLKFIFHSPFNCLSQLLKNTYPCPCLVLIRVISLVVRFFGLQAYRGMVFLHSQSLSLIPCVTSCKRYNISDPSFSDPISASVLSLYAQSHFTKHITPLKPLHRISRNFEAMRKFKFFKIFWEYILHTFSTWKKINWPLLNNMHAFTYIYYQNSLSGLLL